MKYLKKIFEDTSNSLPDDIQDAILNIEDELGQPEISKKTINGVTKYELEWRSYFWQTEYYEKMYRVRHDIDSLIGRLSKNYDTKFNFDQWGGLNFYIQTKTPLEYNFIKKIDEEKKIVYLIESEIIRFFTNQNSGNKPYAYSVPGNFAVSVAIRQMEKSNYNNRNSLKITFKGKQRRFYGMCLDELGKFIREEILRVAGDKSIEISNAVLFASDNIFFIYFWRTEYYEIILVDE